MSYYLVYRDDQKSEPAGIFIVEAAEGRSLIWDHRRRCWADGEGLAIRFLDDYRNFDRYENVQRSDVERVAERVTDGTPLPDEELILAMLKRERSSP